MVWITEHLNHLLSNKRLIDDFFLIINNIQSKCLMLYTIPYVILLKKKKKLYQLWVLKLNWKIYEKWV